MVKRFTIFILILPLFAYAQQLKYLEFKGHKYFKDQQIIKALGLKTPSWYQFYKDPRPKIDPKYSNALLQTLQNFYKSEGFYHASIEKNEDNRTISFQIDAKKPVIIKSIEANLSKEYKSLITMKKGERFKATTFVQIKQNIKKQLQKDGYCNALLDTKAYIDLDKNSADLKYKLQKNDICKFGKINLDIPKNINKKVILSRLNFKEGSDYSSRKIADAYSSISGLEAFNSIQIKPSQNTHTINLDIKLSPKNKRIREEIGVGYETNLGPKALFRWSQRNFQGDARKIEFNIKYSKKEKYLSNTLFWPAFMVLPFSNGYYLDLKNEFSFSKYIYNKFDEKKISNILHLQKDYYLFSIDGGLGFEKIYINKKGEVCNISDGHFFLLYPFIGLIIDTRDSKINPKNGIYLSSYIESGIKYLASDTTYTKFISEARVIKSWNALTMALKGKLGLINEFQKSLPESKLFFAGGAFSNRAYGYNRLGATDSKCEDMGGKTIIETSVEADYWFWEKFGVGLFYDSTMLNLKTFNFDTDFKSSIGTGIRYLTPIGPIKFDIGFDIKDHSQYALHFQVGQSF